MLNFIFQVFIWVGLLASVLLLLAWSILVGIACIPVVFLLTVWRQSVAIVDSGWETPIKQKHDGIKKEIESIIRPPKRIDDIRLN